MLTIYAGVVVPGFQLASGQAVGRQKDPSMFPAGTLEMQHPWLKARGIDLQALVPGLFWGTVNVKTGRKLRLVRPDHTIADLDWTIGVEGPGRIAPETFSWIRCCLACPSAEESNAVGYYPGLIYYPHPETKPCPDAHDFHVLEVLTSKVANLAYDMPASVICRSDAFEAF